MVNVPLIKNRAMGLHTVALEPKTSSQTEEHTVLSDKERNFFVIGFIVLVIVAIIGGFFLWKKNLTYSFFLNENEFSNFIQEAGLLKNNSQNNAGIPVAAVNRTQDIDKDNLTDWEEINIYKTNPYNTDSDSDGVPDGLEVQKGTDPNCPEGQVCKGLPAIAATSSDAAAQNSDIWNSLVANLEQNQNQVAPISVSSATALQLGTISPAELRTLLKNAGAPEIELNKMTDEQLQQAWISFLASQNKL